MSRTSRAVAALLGLARRLAKALIYGGAGGLVVLLVLGVRTLNARPDLRVWHEADLDAEFRANGGVDSFVDYLALEERLFAQLESRVVRRVPEAERTSINRFVRGSQSDPARWPVDWNHSFELPVAEPRAAVLLLHGMSDSPYSLRALGDALQRRGAWVVGLRLPGHGTAPSGLVSVRWEDMAAAVRIAAARLVEC